MIGFLKHRYEPIKDHDRFKLCIVYFILEEANYFNKEPFTDKTHNFCSLIGMNDESIKYRINKNR